MYFIAQFQALLHGFADFRVGIRAGGEVPIRCFLLRHHRHMGRTQLGQQFFYALQAGAVQRGVHQLELLNAGAIANALVIYSLYKIIQAFVVNAHNAACLHTGFIIHQLYAVKAVHFFDCSQNFICHFQRDLAAIGAIHFIAVVLGRVVAGCNADACPAAQIAHRPGKCGRGLQPRVHAGGNAVCRQHAGSFAGEQFAVIAAVMRNGDLFGQVGRVQVIGQALGGLAHRVQVHAVGARPQHTAQAAGAKFQVTVKTVRDSGIIPGNAVQFFRHSGIQFRLGQPTVIQFFRCIHNSTFFLKVSFRKCSLFIKHLHSLYYSRYLAAKKAAAGKNFTSRGNYTFCIILSLTPYRAAHRRVPAPPSPRGSAPAATQCPAARWQMHRQ